MKKVIFYLFLMIPLLLSAQDDSKYLAGAIPVVDGKIAFQTEINAPSLSKQKLYELTLNWAKSRFKPTSNMNANVVYTNEKEGTIAARGEEYIVFSSSTFSLDRTRIYYILSISCEKGKVKLNMERISYWYDEARNGGVKYKAEDWITDNMALNKAKNKLSPITGKFRKKTIDLKDELFKEINSSIGDSYTTNNTNTQPSNVNTAIETSTINNVQLSDDQKIQESNRLSVTAGEDEKVELSKDSWGGFGDILGKKVTFLIVNKSKKMTNILLNENEKYNISFYNSTSNSPTLTISCKKLMKKELSNEEIIKFNLSSNDNDVYYMYIGEIVD